jgi:predicted RNase H-like nuclease
VKFLGVDLAWRPDNPSGVAVLDGTRFPLRLAAAPHTLPTHDAVLAWIDRQVEGAAASVGIDAPLLGLERPGRRPCDNEVSRVFGRFHASTHTPSGVPALAELTARLVRRYGLHALDPAARAQPGRPTIREVYPHALQVRLFDLDRTDGVILKYKRRRFRAKTDWVRAGLVPFVARSARELVGTYVRPTDPGWRALCAARPQTVMTGRDLKDLEDRWDALLCALAVALAVLRPGSMRAYPGDGGARAWRRGYILAPALTAGRAAWASANIVR